MKIISWNVQGLKGVQVMQEIKILNRIHKPNMLFLLETMVNEINLLRILSNLGFRHFDYVLPHNHSGGIAAYGTLEIFMRQFYPKSIEPFIC